MEIQSKGHKPEGIETAYSTYTNRELILSVAMRRAQLLEEQILKTASLFDMGNLVLADKFLNNHTTMFGKLSVGLQEGSVTREGLIKELTEGPVQK